MSRPAGGRAAGGRTARGPLQLAMPALRQLTGRRYMRLGRSSSQHRARIGTSTSVAPGNIRSRPARARRLLAPNGARARRAVCGRRRCDNHRRHLRRPGRFSQGFS
jgi:hypothetical protein